jgi:HAMP domain-containing protein
MSLRVRLLLGYGYLVALLLLAAGSAMLGFLHLSESVDVVLEENYTTIRAAMRMLEALERQDSATLAALLEGGAAADELAGFEQTFLDALADAESNVTEAGEEPVLAALRGDFERYRTSRMKLIEERPAAPLRAYNDRVFPAFVAVKRNVLELLDVNQRAMIDADREAKRAAVQNGAWLGALVAVALLSLVVLSRALQRRLLARLEVLLGGMAGIGSGDFRRRLRLEGNDELAQIGEEYNRLLEQLQSREARYQGRLAEERRSVLGLVERLGEGSALYSLSGQLLAQAGEGEEPPAPEVARWIESEGRRRLPELADDEELSARVEEEGAGEAAAAPAYRVDLLRAAGGRKVGWLVRPD